MVTGSVSYDIFISYVVLMESTFLAMGLAFYMEIICFPFP